jgi:hypothetical protein
MESQPNESAAASHITASTVEPPLQDPTERVARLERDLAEAQRSLKLAETRASIQRALAGAGAVDADAVALVVESSIPKGDAPFDVAAIARAIDEIRRTRPGLFRTPTPARSTTMPARVERPATRLEDAATHAAKRGDRASLMHYLRMKRTA